MRTVKNAPANDESSSGVRLPFPKSPLKSSLYNVYASLPVFMQNAIWSLMGVGTFVRRYNTHFFRTLRFLEESQWWSLEQQKAYQAERLQSLILHAYNTCQYYREIFDSLHLRPSDIRTPEDLEKLPILEKSTIRKHYTRMRSSNWPTSRQVHIYTGGTTGTALDLVCDRDTVTWQWAVWWRHRRRFSINIWDPHVEMAGHPIVPLERMTPPIWRRNLVMRQTYVSAHHMTRMNMQALYEYLNKRDAVYYAGYPSAFYLLAVHMLENGLNLSRPPKLAVTGSETLLPHQRNCIEKAFSAEVTDQYGASESCGNISECERHRYHVDMEFGVIEFLPIPGMPSNVRRIVCTGLTNPAMPLIRYNIGDTATLSSAACPCGRQSPVVEKIDGRIESYIITPDGRRLGRLDFLFKETERIEEAQLIQDRIDRVTVRVVRSQHYGARDEQILLANLRRYLGDEIILDIEYLNEIPRESNGKFRQIVSSVFRDRYAESANAPNNEGHITL